MIIETEWVNTIIESLLGEITDYRKVELSEKEFEQLCEKTENELESYDDIEESNIEYMINSHLVSIGYTYDEDSCLWSK